MRCEGSAEFEESALDALREYDVLEFDLWRVELGSFDELVDLGVEPDDVVQDAPVQLDPLLGQVRGPGRVPATPRDAQNAALDEARVLVEARAVRDLVRERLGAEDGEQRADLVCAL